MFYWKSILPVVKYPFKCVKKKKNYIAAWRQKNKTKKKQIILNFLMPRYLHVSAHIYMPLAPNSCLETWPTSHCEAIMDRLQIFKMLLLLFLFTSYSSICFPLILE